jgi:hypothetical protein
MGRIVLIVAVANLLGGTLAGCGSISEVISDSWPHWAGGLPPDTPPRPNDPRYDDYIKSIKGLATQPNQQIEKSENQSTTVKGQ